MTKPNKLSFCDKKCSACRCVFNQFCCVCEFLV
jgi:hypothetical protein